MVFSSGFYICINLITLNMPKKDGSGPSHKSTGAKDGSGAGKGTHAKGKGKGKKTGGKKGSC